MTMKSRVELVRTLVVCLGMLCFDRHLAVDRDYIGALLTTTQRTSTPRRNNGH